MLEIAKFCAEKCFELTKWNFHISNYCSFTSQILLGILISEFFVYLDHRLTHTQPFLWKIHTIHHMATKVSVVNNARHHFLDNAKAIFPTYLTFLWLGFSSKAIFWSQLIIVIIALVSHSNVDVDCRFWGKFFITPEIHRWHHSKIRKERNNNYGAAFLIWDVIFGSKYYPEISGPQEFGANAKVPDSIFGQLAYPFK